MAYTVKEIKDIIATAKKFGVNNISIETTEESLTLDFGRADDPEAPITQTTPPGALSVRPVV